MVVCRSVPKILVAAALLVLSSGNLTADVCMPEPVDRPRIALVLGGGGARGAAHIGVIKALEELRVPVDYIAGTSMGSLVGGLKASGMSGAEIESVITNIDWADVFADDINRADRPIRRKRDDDLGLYGTKIGLSEGSSRLPKGAVAGQKVLFLLESIVGPRHRGDDFDSLPIPFRAVAVDIIAAEPVVINNGKLSVAMRSSMALPAVFDPVEDGERLLVDGGVLMNLPVSVGKEMGADIVIAVDVGSALAPKEDVKNVLQVLYQLIGVVTVVNSRQQTALLSDDDFILYPPLDDALTTGSFANSADAIPAGYSETMKYRDEFSQYALSDSEWGRRQASIAICVEGLPVIEFVRLNNQSRFVDEVIQRRLSVEIGATLDLDSLEKQIEDIYSLGFLQSVSFEIIEDGGQTGLRVDVMPDARGTDFFEYGLGIHSSNFESGFNLRLGYLKTDVGGYGGEFRSLVQIGGDMGGLVELYKPLGPSLKYVFIPRAAFERTTLNVFDDDGNTLSQMDVDDSLLQIGFAREFGNSMSLTAGLRFGTGTVDIGIGDPSIPEYDFDSGAYFLEGKYDTQDNRFFPGSGTNADFRILQSTPALGADSEFAQITSSYFHAWTVGRHSFLAGAEVDVSSDDPIPLQNLFRAGGFPRMSGYEFGELTGENFAMALGGYRYKLLDSSIFPGYLGGTIEYGNVYANRSDIFTDGLLNGSVYFGIDSLLGPLYIGIGFAEGGRRIPFLTIGSIFNRDRLTQ